MPTVNKSGEATRNNLITSAEKLFAKKGFDGVSVREITTAANSNIAAINYHFGGKKELYLEVFRSRWLPRAQRIRQPLADLYERNDLTPEEILRTLAMCLLKAHVSEEERKLHYRLSAQEANKPTEAMEIVVQEGMRPMIDMVGELLEKCTGIKPDSRKQTLNVLSVFGQMAYFSMARGLVSTLFHAEFNEELTEEIIGHFVDFSMKGLGCEPCRD